MSQRPEISNHFSTAETNSMKIQNGRICVVLVIDDLGFGGAERQVVELANNIDRNRFDQFEIDNSQLDILRN